MKSRTIYRQLVALLLIAAFFAQTFSRVFVIADYYTNTSNYAQNCVNKARPMMHCNGKCQMMKRLAQEEKKDQENHERRSDNKAEIILSTRSSFATVPPQFVPDNANKPLPSPNGRATDRSLDIFHPPQA